MNLSIHNVVSARIERKRFGENGFHTLSIIFTDATGREDEVCAFTSTRIELDAGDDLVYSSDGKKVLGRKHEPHFTLWAW